LKGVNAMYSVDIRDFDNVLNETYHSLNESDSKTKLDGFFSCLNNIRDIVPIYYWKDVVVPKCRESELAKMLYQDPFTLHSVKRPRGYPGDAELIDFIYGSANIQKELDKTTDFGRMLHKYFINTLPCKAVRARKDMIADEIDRVADEKAFPHILSIACGHLREASLSRAAQNKALGRYVALDQDTFTIESVKNEFSDIGVEMYPWSVKNLICSKKNQLGKFDFIYTSGLYDYLNDHVGSRLLSVMFQMLNPGGKLWITNFAPNAYGIGYMEAFMDWWLIFRDQEAIQKLMADIPNDQVAKQRVFSEANENVLFLEIQKAI
jgi:extracellular factor (EF) 3-hydroxypalmitic acid methyl ester biosynthesis protein